jgi:hypothetical protein
MDSGLRQNTKARVNVACPNCGMNLQKAPNAGFAKYGDTYCCQGCADGTGCTCNASREVRKSFNRPGDIGWRNAENTARDKNFNAEETTSSRPIGSGNRKQSRGKRMPSRDQREWAPRSKRLKTANKPKDSTREQARGRSEERGRMAKPAATRRAGSRGGDRISRTGSKGK